MIAQSKNIFLELKKIGLSERKSLADFVTLKKEVENSVGGEKGMIASELELTKKRITESAANYVRIVEGLNLIRPLKEEKPITEKKEPEKKEKPKEISELERKAIKRWGRKKKKEKISSQTKPRNYVEFANRFFFRFSEGFVKKYKFAELKKDLIKANMQFVPESYLSLLILTVLILFMVGVVISATLVFFEFSFLSPVISLTKEPLILRAGKFGWLALAIPALAGLIIYSYPSMERKAAGKKIDQELPFATIHMSAIAESMLNPKGIFEILIKTEEYDSLKKEFTKLLNEINVHGMNLVNALRNRASKSPSSNLTDLFNGLATTINSGGELKEFFEKRSQTLLFEHKIEREKSAKVAETFMDIYISIVIAAPMILMLLLMIMNVSGIGIGLTPSMISLLMVLGVGMINVIFLVFIHLRQPVQ